MGWAKQLSLCLVTRNNEKYLSDCLQEIRQITDEIVIADMGSTDQSVDIARKAGARVYQTEWENDYSKVKNFCLDQAEGRWVLFLRPNEKIPGEQLNLIRPLLKNPNAEGYLIYIEQVPQHYRILSPVQALRLFRNRKEYRYRYQAFEAIPDKLIANLRDSAVRIHQYTDLDKDYDSDAFQLLQKELEEHPEDCYLQYIYGIELLNRNRTADSLPYFIAAHHNVNLDYLFAPHLYKCFAWSYIALEQYHEALGILDEGIGHFPFYSDLLVLRGDLRKYQRSFREAIRDLETSYKIKEQPDRAVPAPEIGSPVILESLGEIHEQLLNYQCAFECYRHALELNEANHQLLYKIGNLTIEENAAEYLDLLFKRAAEQKNCELMMILIDVFYQQHNYSRVLSYLEYLEPYLETEQIDSIRNSCGRKLDVTLFLNEENDDDQLIKLGLLWAEKGDLEVIRQIFKKVSSNEKQMEFKQKIIMELLRNRQVEVARELADSEDSMNFGALDYVLESAVLMSKLEESIGKLRRKKQEEENAKSAEIPLNAKSGKSDGEPACDEVHCKIGEFYEKSNQRGEAFFAYLRALQWNPFHEAAQSKIISMVKGNTDQFYDVLNEKNFMIEGSWFHDKEGFIQYIHGLIQFKNHQFSLASETFEKITDHESSYSLSLAYRICCLWIEGNEEAAEKLMMEQKSIQRIDSFIFLICKSYVLDRLAEGYHKYPYSEIILREKQRVSNLEWINPN